MLHLDLILSIGLVASRSRFRQENIQVSQTDLFRAAVSYIYFLK